MKSGYKDYLDQYTNLVNQPTWADNVGDAYSKAGSQPAQGASQRSTNALLLGVGAGLKGGAAQDRQQQLSPMLQQAGQITAKAAELEAQAQQEQSRQFAVQEFGQKYTPLVATFADLVNNNDPRSVIVFKDLISKAGSIPGYENLEAESWDASKGYGLALNTQTGEYRKITADEIISAIAPSAQAIYGDKWFEKFLPLNAGVAKDAQYAFNTNRQATELGLNEKRAGIANQYSQANQHNATAESTRHEMNNPEQEKGTIDPKKMEQDLSVLSQQITKIGKKGEQGGWSRVMSEVTPGHVYQLTPEQTQIDTLGQLMRGQMFKAFGYRNETEFEQIPTISSNNTVEQNQAIVKQYNNLFLKGQQGQDDIVEVISPSGKIGMIPKSSLEDAMAKGFKAR